MCDLFIMIWAMVMGCSGDCCFGVIYIEWYGVCNFVVISVVEVLVDYGAVDVFHIYFHLCLDICGVVKS